MYDLFVASKAAIALQLKMLQNTNFFCSLTNYRLVCMWRICTKAATSSMIDAVAL